jgi:hypothetical protein
VNEYTLALDESAVVKMLQGGEQEGVFPRGGRAPLFA